MSLFQKHCENILKRTVLLLMFALCGCCSINHGQVSFISHALPVAVVGMHYHAQLKTRGLPVSTMSVEHSLAVDGLKIIPMPTADVNRWYIDISGVPEKEGEYTFWVKGSTVGTQCPGRDFSNKFTLVVVNARQKK